MGERHKKTATRIARKLGTKHRRKGVDILSNGNAIEVAVTPGDIYSSAKQLKKSRASKKYMAVPARKTTLARRLLKGTGIGVMDLRCSVRKRTRKSRR